MNKSMIFGIIGVFMAALAGNAMAGEMSHDMGHGAAAEGAGHGTHQMTATGGTAEMDHSGHGGELIHEGVVDGYRFAYHLTDIREKMAAMKAAGHAHEGMDATHHLMVYIEAPEGTPAGGAQVGFLVTGPDGETQKLMCMEMGGGYGSDVNFGTGGEYTVKTKGVIGEVKLVDAFSYVAQ